jgi:hypothetical protein
MTGWSLVVAWQLLSVLQPPFRAGEHYNGSAAAMTNSTSCFSSFVQRAFRGNLRPSPFKQRVASFPAEWLEVISTIPRWIGIRPSKTPSTF